MTSNKIKTLRSTLQDLDTEIIHHLNKRAEVCLDIGRIKSDQGLDIYDPSQEARVYNRLRKVNDGPLPDHHLRNIFREIISTSRALQAPVTVAFLGPEASFSHLAVLSHFGRGICIAPKTTIADVFEDVERHKAPWGIVPVDNSTEGPVKPTLDRLITTPLNIRGEVYVRISHSLVSIGGKKKTIKRVYSHPQALAQCQEWLRKNLPQAILIDMDSTAAAALKIRENPQDAAICSRLAAEHYGLHILEEGIEDHPLNTTRFLVIGYGTGEPTGNDKTSILFGTPHTPGSLYHALEAFAKAGINLIRIASYPIRDRLWEYLFFADLVGHSEEPPISRCLKDMGDKTAFIKILGAYPLGEEL
jgi:chorismate mutase / prephenate dehydratase